MEDKATIAQAKLATESVFDELKIRTMQDDLKKAAGIAISGKADASQPPASATLSASAQKIVAPPAPPKPASSPLPVPPKPTLSPPPPPGLPTSTPIPSATTQKPTLKIPVGLEQTLDQAQMALVKGSFQEASSLAEKIAKDKTASWTLIFKANKIISEASEKNRTAAPAPSIPPKTAVPPAGLPAVPSGAPFPELKLPTPPGLPSSQPQGALPTPKPISISTPIQQPPKPLATPPKPTIPQPPTPLPPVAPKPTAKTLTTVSYPEAMSDKTPISQSVLDMTKPTIKPPFSLGRVVVTSAICLIILAGLGYGYLNYWPYWPKVATPVCVDGQISQECVCGSQAQTAGFCCNAQWLAQDCSVLIPPVSIIPSAIQLITLDTNSSVPILDQVQTATQDITSKSLLLVALKTGDNPATYATTLDGLAKILNINLPQSIKDNTSAFNLLAFVKPADASSSAETRLVLALKEKDASAAIPTMSDWEATMLQDLKPMIMGSPGDSATPDFQSFSYHNGAFRYKNLPQSNVTINYVLSDDFVIIGTSKNSIFYVFDAVNSQ